MAELPQWARLPSRWVSTGGLKRFHWQDGGADNVAALMALIVVAQHADRATGIAQISYDEICRAARISRAKLRGGLALLQSREIVKPWQDGRRGRYQLLDYDPEAHWAKIPALRLYRKGRIEAFEGFRLRREVELDALKLYLLFAALRDNDANMAVVAYPRIEALSGVHKDRIRHAVTLLAAANLVFVERVSTGRTPGAIANGYRLAHVDPRTHFGTMPDPMEYVGFGSEEAASDSLRRHL